MNACSIGAYYDDRASNPAFGSARRAGKALIVGLTLALYACAIYRPRPEVDLNSLPQLRTQSEGRLCQEDAQASCRTRDEGKPFGAVL
jgi:hypothetical protein